MIPLLVSEISGCDAFCDVQDEELGILVEGNRANLRIATLMIIDI